MKTRLLAALGFSGLLTGIAIAASQSPADDERRSAITALRMINTAENAIRQKEGRYVAMPALLEHAAGGGVKGKIVVSGNTFKLGNAEVRLALSADATQYIVTVVSPSYTAAFTDERGVIYTGKALE